MNTKQSARIHGRSVMISCCSHNPVIEMGMSSTANVNSQCTTCAKDGPTTKLKLCAECLSVRYCSRECQKSDWKFHKTTCGVDTRSMETTGDGRLSQPLYALKAISGQCQGLFATTRIPRGTRILIEASIFEVRRDVYDIEEVDRQVQKAVGRLQQRQQEAFFTLHNAHGDNHSAALGIARTNALPLGANAAKSGIFLEASRINHSCSHNAQNTWNADLNQITIHAIRDIQQGEEICISYVDGHNDYATRQKFLKKYFNFSCVCALCSLPEDLRRQSDMRRNKIGDLDGSIGDGVRITSAPLSCLNDAYELLKLLGEEQIIDASLPRLYYDAFQICIANGDEARARTFAKMAYDERIMLEGEDSPNVNRQKTLMENPRSHGLYGTSLRWEQSMSNIPQDLGQEEFAEWLWRRK